jgi:hypothetical protein
MPWGEAWDRGDAWKKHIIGGLWKRPENGDAALKLVLGADTVETLLVKSLAYGCGAGHRRYSDTAASRRNIAG